VAHRAWGTCELVVMVRRPGEADEELARVELGRASATRTLDFGLPGADSSRRRLVVRVEPGAFGPIQDRVVLRRPLLLID